MSRHTTLKLVRKQRHFDLEDVAAYAHISAARLEEFEAGDRDPSFKQIEKLAALYGVPSYQLFSEARPNLPETLPDFRKSVIAPAHLTPGGAQKVWAAQSIAEFANQLAVELDFRAPKWAGEVDTGPPTVKRAASLRCYFDDWFEKRRRRLAFAGSYEQIFLGAFRLFLEAQGTVVNINQAPAGEYFGFYLDPDAGLPLVFVNRTISSKKAQLFTLLHEYAHHLMGATGVSNPFVARNSVERTCNKFAAEFLAPMVAFAPLVERQPRHIRSDPAALIRQVSDASLLSLHATAIRLVEGGYLTQEQLQAWEKLVRKNPGAEKQEEAEAAGEAQGAVHAKRIGELGYLPTTLARRGIEAGMIDSLDVQAGLGLSEGLQAKAFALAERRMQAAQD